ncbi:MAG: hypothetical protein ABL901_18660 [Hyphomicrobiaceae bacterium]
MTFKPMLASPAPETIKFPVLASPKLDGIRCIIRDGVAFSRNLKPIPNAFIQKCLAGLPELDGELICGSPVGNDVWNRSNSGVMSRDGEPDFLFHVFDHVESGPFKDRLATARHLVADKFTPGSRLIMVPHIHIGTMDLLNTKEQQWIDDGFEGMMIRDPNGPYKFGRSTTKEGYLLKVKRFEDHEATVVGVVEQMRNENEATKDALGRTKRSTAKAGKVGKGTLGAFECEFQRVSNVDGISSSHTAFELGSGMNDAQRAEFWKTPPIGALVTFKCQGFTPDGMPRFPIFKGIRQDAA